MPSGLMFHALHDGIAHPKVQGSLEADELRRAIDRYQNRLLNAKDFLAMHEHGMLDPDALCLTFDDGVRSQWDIARPVLEEYHLTAFFFVPTAPLIGIASRLEIYRYLRTVICGHVGEFYRQWRKHAEVARVPNGYLAEHTYLTDEDRAYRYWRDHQADPREYADTMDRLLADHGWPEARFADYQTLWMSARQVQDLHSAGHIIGAHSHTHPTRLGALPEEAQESEYQTAHYILTQLLGVAPRAMSHPNNEYSGHGLQVLSALGYVLGFRATPGDPGKYYRVHGLEVPRVDSADLR